MIQSSSVAACWRWCIQICVWSFVLCSSAVAQTYTVDLIYPQIGQAGTTVEVIALGSYLQEPKEVLFYQPGIRCTKLEPVNEVIEFRGGQPRKVEDGAAVRLTLEIADDARPGEYQLRLRTADKLAEMVTFWVTPFPVVKERHAWEDRERSGSPLRNDSAEHAQGIPLNCTVEGYVPASLAQDNDWYSVQCQANQRLSVEAVAARLGTHHYGGMNDPAISIFDDAGNLLGRNDDNSLHNQDPVVSIIVPEDGRYFIQMRQQMDYETVMRHYALHVGTFPRPLVAYPLGVQSGEGMQVTLLGDPTGPIKASVPAGTRSGPFERAIVEVFAKADEQAPSGNRVKLADMPNILEQESASSEEEPQRVSARLPVALNGRIESEGEVDWYRFSANKGERYRVFGYGKSLDSELDPRIWIRPAPGNPSRRSYDVDDSRWEPHDLVGHHYREQIKNRLDPVFMFEPDTDGDWLLGIGDTRRESSDRHIYRVEFQPHVDSAFVFFPQYPSQAKIVRDRVVLFPGHSLMHPMGVQPGFGSKYNGTLRLRAKNLPDGVSMSAPPFSQNDKVIPVIFTADEKVELGARTIDMVVEPVDRAARSAFRGGFVQVNPSTQRRGGYAMYFDRTRIMALGVVEGARFNLTMDVPTVPLVRNGELTLTVHVERHEGFQGAVYCEADWLPPGVNKQPPLVIPPGETKGLYRLRAGSNAAHGEFPISITGREYEGGSPRTGAGIHYACSPSVQLSVGEPYVTVTLTRSAIERGSVGTIKAEVSHHRGFQGTAVMKLGRLPFGVEQVKPFPSIGAGDNRVTFSVLVTNDCLVGQYKDIFCEVIVTDGGQEIRQQTGSGTLRVDAERK